VEEGLGLLSWEDVAAEILDRLHHGTVLTINGPSYCMRRHHQRIEQLRAGRQPAGAAKQ
jgi:DNA replication protein DnaC